MATESKLRWVLGRGDLLAIFAMILTTNFANGIARATFPLHAESLGASLSMIGAQGGVEGLVRILLSMPFGLLSDRIGRQVVLGIGLFAFLASYTLYALVQNPVHLYLIRILTGVSVASTYFIGIAYVSDIVKTEDQGLAIGIYTACMGIGWTAGSVVGGWVAEAAGYSASFGVAAISMLTSFACLYLGRSPQWEGALQPEARMGDQPLTRSRIGSVLRNPGIWATSLSHLVLAAATEGAAFVFFPLYAASLAISQGLIGSMLSVRALFSTLARLPAGLLVARFSSGRLLKAAIVLSLTAMAAVSLTTSPVILTLLLIGEGIAFGICLASGGTAIAEHSAERTRGTAMGFFITAGSVGAFMGPSIMGPAAEAWGLSSVFLLAALLLLAGLLVVVVLYGRAGRLGATKFSP